MIIQSSAGAAFFVSLICFGISSAAWNISTYYVLDRESQQSLEEIQPSAVTKSTLAFYTFDGLAVSMDINFFLVIFTDWCAVYYNETLTPAEVEDRINVNYIQLYQINMSEFTPSDYHDYTNVNSFFIRHLMPGIRPIDSPLDTTVLTAPADARYTVLETIPTDFNVTIKSETYTLTDLFGSESKGALFNGGMMIIARLAPQDYHRYHAPADGTVVMRTPLAGTIFSVNADAVPSGNEVFYNKRVVTLVTTPSLGVMGFISVGATCVGSIVEVFDEGSEWTKGAEIGHFEYGGSTMIMFFQQGMVVADDDLVHSSQLHVENFVKMGTRIGVAAA